MPKESKAWTPHRPASPPYTTSPSSSRALRSSNSHVEPPGFAAKVKEWEDVRCPVCMEHPHNAVLLICSSHDRGCLPFMCDTSYRHSNCLDQYRKAVASASSVCGDCQQDGLTCPLCRGSVSRWMVDEAARRYMNAKSRGCSTESCNFVGAYRDLRKHARKEHPLVRPSRADAEREREWQLMEQRHDLEDMRAMLHSELGLNNGELDFGEDEQDTPVQLALRMITMFVFAQREATTAVRVMRVYSRFPSRRQSGRYLFIYRRRNTAADGSVEEWVEEDGGLRDAAVISSGDFETPEAVNATTSPSATTVDSTNNQAAWDVEASIGSLFGEDVGDDAGGDEDGNGGLRWEE